jgi:hypothetical protein
MSGSTTNQSAAEKGKNKPADKPAESEPKPSPFRRGAVSVDTKDDFAKLRPVYDEKVNLIRYE